MSSDQRTNRNSEFKFNFRFFGLDLLLKTLTHLECEGKPATIYVKDGKIVGGSDDGEPYEGVLRGTQGNDVIVGADQDDIILGMGGDDIICGGLGDDLIRGGAGADIIFGEPGDDDIKT